MHKHLVLFFLLITSLSCCFDSVLPNRYTLSGSKDALTEKDLIQVAHKAKGNPEKENLTYSGHSLGSFFCLFTGEFENKEKEHENPHYLSTQVNLYSNHPNLGSISIKPVSRPILFISLYLFNCIFLL